VSPAPRRGAAGTSARSPDPLLRGRTFSIPFEDVWQASLQLVGGRLRGWTVREADDQVGIIRAEVRGLLASEHDITISITLDENAQTRVDATAQARKPDWDLGASRRRLVRYFRALDRALARGRSRGPRASQPHRSGTEPAQPAPRS
jgi:hypothetical protein